MANGLDAQQDIFASNPDDRRAFEALEEHYFLDGDWESLVELYRTRLAAPGVSADPNLQAPLLFRLGQILEERILDLEAASEAYWTLARLDPSNRPALRQLRGLHTRTGKWDLVLQIAELESQTPMPPYERAAFETELGSTWQRHLGDVGEACRAYERALEADPEYPPALEALASLHQEAGRHREAAEILTRLSERLRGPERAPVWVALGSLLARALDDPARARHCFERALEDDPFQAPAVEWSLLLAMADEDWPAVAELLERRFDLAAGARHRAAVAVEASQIQLNHLDSPAGARAWTDRAAELAPDEVAVLFAVADVERADGDRRALCAALDRLTRLGDPSVPRQVFVEAAEVHSELGDAEAALAAVRLAAERPGSDDGRVLALQARLLRENGSKRELAEVLETLTSLEGGQDERQRAEQLRELARLQEQDLGEEATAETTWQRAFALDPAHRDAIEALDRIHRKHDDWSALRGTLETALSATTEAAEQERLSVDLGLLLLDHLDDATRARGLFESTLAANPRSAPALAGLRRLAEAVDDPDLLLDVCEREAADCDDSERMAELARAAIPILVAASRAEEALAWAERWSQAVPRSVEALQARVQFQARLGRPHEEIESHRKLAKLLEGRERAVCLRRCATLQIQVGDDAAAGASLESALAGGEADRTTLDALAGVYRRMLRPSELAQTLRKLVEVVPPVERAEPLEELATILQDPIGDLEAAIVVRWQLVELDDAPVAAHTKLEELLELAGRHEELAQLLDARRQMLGDETAEAFELDLRRGALLLDALGRGEDAARIFAALHERHPDDDAIVDQLERALRVGDDIAGLCELLERRASWETDPTRRRAITLERASLLEDVLGEPLRACDLYESILEEHAGTPEAAAAAARLEALLESSGQWQRLRERLTHQLDDLEGEAQATLRERIAAICRDRLQDVAGCAAQLEAIAELVPERVHVWQQLGEIYAHELDRPADWMRVVEAELATGALPQRELALRVAAARLLLDDDRRPPGRERDEAHGHYERVLALHPTHAEAAEVLALHYAAVDRPEDTARILERRLEGLGDAGGAEANDLRIRLGTLLSTTLREDSRAQEYFESARRALGAIPRIAEPLADLYERAGAFAELCALCHQAIDRESTPDAELRWRMRLGQSERRAGRPAEAAAAFRAALERSPDDREIEDALIGLYEELEETEPLARLLEKRLPFASEDESIDLRLRLARLHADRRNEPNEALRHLEWILESHPQHRDAFERALDVAERIGQPERILALLDRALDTPLANAERATLLERRAALLADELDRGEAAVTSLREVLALDRTRAGARQKLRAELEKLGRWPAALDCLFVQACEADAEARIGLLEEGAEIAWTRIDPDAALPWLARLRAARPEDPALLVRIADAHRRAGRFEAALRAHDDELELQSDPAERCALHLKRARLLERELGAPGRAIHAYQQALELAADPREILAELDRLFASQGRRFERADVLERRISLLAGDDTSDERVAMRRTLSTLYCVELAKPDLAIPHLEANALAARGDDRAELDALAALNRALRAGARHDAWARTAERELRLIEGDPAIRSSTPPDYLRFLHEELARAYDVDLGAPDLALEHLRVLCDEAETSTPVLRARLRDLLRRTRRIPELADCLSAELEGDPSRDGAASADEPGDADAWLELARLREEALMDLPGALEAYRRAESDPALRLDAVRGQRRCCERLRDWTGLAEALEAEYALEDRLEPRERITLARALGDVAWQRLGSGERAAAGYQRALDLDPNDLPTLRALTRVHEAGSAFDEAIPLYRRELDRLGDTPADRQRRKEIWLRLAAIHQTERDAPRDAIDAYRQAAEVERLSADDELALARLYASIDDADGFAETFAGWCDREDSPASTAHHLELARHHRERGQAEAARTRAERATALDPDDPEAWRLRGLLERDADELEKAAESFERASRNASTERAASALVEAAACVDALDPERASELLARATRLDPALLSARVASTRIASRLERSEDATQHAERALELAAAEPLDDAVHVEVALLGARAAWRRDDRDAALRLFEAVLAVAPDHVEALEGTAEVHFANEDFVAAREPLERRVERSGEDPRRARHAMMIGRGLEADDLLDAAWARYEESIGVDPSIDEAHDGLARIHERAGRVDDAIAALEHWSKASDEAGTRAVAALRAAEHAMAAEDTRRAVDDLERATREDPTLTPAWVLLCELVEQRDGEGEARRACDAALEAIEPGAQAVPIFVRAARLAEVASDRERAIDHYAAAVRWDPRATDAALSRSRLIRAEGDWDAADRVLAEFIAAHPDADSPSLARVHLERGRLLSGPLERFEEAIVAYERALVLQPELGVARTALAGLLQHAPDRWRDALGLHREILSASPTTVQSLRGLVQIAEQREQPETVEAGLAVLHALGEASPHEADSAPAHLRIQIQHGPPMQDPDDERWRRIAHQLGEDLAGVLADVPRPAPPCADPAVDEAIGRILDVEDELTAPRLTALDDETRGALFADVAALFSDPGGAAGESPFAEALDRAVGRWNRRKIRRILEESPLDASRAHDPTAWLCALRAMAAAQVIDRHGGDLRSVLRALLALETAGEPPPEFDGTELGTRASTSETARMLLSRITNMLCDRVERGR